MKVILIDDEAIALEVLIYALQNYKGIEIVGSYTDPFQALEELKIKDPDVLFLDIEMGPINGLEISEYFLQEKESLEIIFVTAYPQYAVGAFEIDAIDYLLKPVQKSRLDMAIKRLKERLSTSAYSSSKKINRDLRINSFGSFQVLDRDNKPLVWRTKKGKELFAYLWAQEGQPATRDQVMEHVFSHIDNNRGSALLHTTIYQIRKGLSNLGYLDGIIYTNDGYKLNLPITSDLDDLTTILKREEYNRDDIIEILEIYRGDYLQAEGYHWALGTQQLYQDLVLNALIDYIGIELAIASNSILTRVCLDFMYDLDPFRDDIVNMYIQYLGESGNKHGLQEFYHKHRDFLRREMEEGISKGTELMYNKYVKN